MSDIEKLAEVSEMAEYLKKQQFEVIDLKDAVSFSPNGKCGYIEANDDYIFDIRCDKLMWAEGNCEGTEWFWELSDRGGEYNSILIYGNHKGILKIKLVIFHE